MEQFHFLEPLWLFALIPLALLFFFAFQATTNSRAWEKIIDPKLLPLLLNGEDGTKNRFPKYLLAIAWMIAVIALADPVWEKIPRPIFQTNAARVIVLDLSNSMLIDDLKPSRIARARFKIEDILAREEEGRTGLVLFAGEAFTAVPLTRDIETIRSMLKELTPQIMPAQGSRVDKGLQKAHELLKQAGITRGQILLIADGVSQKKASLGTATNLRNDGHSISVMAVGTEAGGKLNFRNNISQVVKLDAKALKDIAESGGGKYHLMTANSTDLKYLLNSVTDNSALENSVNQQTANEQNREWRSTGPLLVLLLLPFAALAFRRGWLLNLSIAFLLIGYVLPLQEVIAAENKQENLPQDKWGSMLEKLTKNKAQRINQAFMNEQYEKARDLSDDPLSQGSAEYKLENYEEALTNFKQAEGADARYNEGNALAKLQKYTEAVTAYDKALTLDSSMQDAQDNKKAIEDFLKQQQQSGEDSQSSNENQEGNSNAQNDQQEGNSQEAQDKQGDSKSASNDDKEQQNQQKDQTDNKNQQNQFSDANEDLDKNKENAKEEQLESAQNDKEGKGDEESESDKNNMQSAEKHEEESNEDQTGLENRQKQVAEELSQEEKMAAEQWLRRIPDDPGGLLRRKFRYQYNQNRRNSRPNTTEQPW